MSVCVNCNCEDPRWREVATGAHRCLRCVLDHGQSKAHVAITFGDLPEIVIEGDTDGDEEPTLPDDQVENDEIEEAGAGFDPFFAWDEIALSLQITGDEAEAITCALEAGREQARKLMAVLRRYEFAMLRCAERTSA